MSEPTIEPLEENLKCGTYSVIRNTPGYYTFQVTLRLMHIVKGAPEMLWLCPDKDVEIKIVGRDLLFTREEEEFGITIQLPPSADLESTPIVDKPERGGCYVTIVKKGNTEEPPKIPDEITGRGRRKITVNGKEVAPEDVPVAK